MNAILKRYPARVACILIAIVCGVAVFLIGGNIEKASTRLGEKTLEGEKLALNIRNAAQLPEQLEILTSNGKKIQERLIRASQLANNLQYFYRLESETGVELVDVRQTSSPALKGAMQGIGFAVSVKAEYPVLVAYLRKLENGPHFCRILTSTISAATSDTGRRNGPLVLALNLELLGQP